MYLFLRIIGNITYLYTLYCQTCKEAKGLILFKLKIENEKVLITSICSNYKKSVPLSIHSLTNGPQTTDLKLCCNDSTRSAIGWTCVCIHAALTFTSLTAGQGLPVLHAAGQQINCYSIMLNCLISQSNPMIWPLIQCALRYNFNYFT